RPRRRGSHPLDPVGLSDWPDLVMIDGGKGQLSAVMGALHQLGLAEDLHVCALAKRREQVFLPGSREPLDSEPDQLGLLLLQRLRDEAHRFAVAYHRQQRRDRMKRSRLSEAPGLGPKRSRTLLSHFRSLDAIQSASAEQIAQVEGIGPGVARQVWEFFHPQGQ
ncbi:helix-hairpin-helix domain-containing protein, partial [Candidatus Synechococcus spongiarum]|uniref:helix-hairpin-helix domain-containing protein n=1 Tax=Candidatus Synechococcus spongiarum TaxID=431041 RepID=UPI000556D21A